MVVCVGEKTKNPHSIWQDKKGNDDGSRITGKIV